MEIFTFSIIGLLLTFIGMLIWQRIRMLKLREECGFKGPAIGLPQFFMGHIYDIMQHARKYGQSAMPSFILKWKKEHGDVFGVNVYDPEMIKEIFIKQFSCFVSREVSTFTQGYPLGESLLQVEKEGPHGYGWKEIRSIASPTFTTGKMKMVSTFTQGYPLGESLLQVEKEGPHGY
uniref:Cytochrome P450 n=1 Tax=Panagrolaimus sp. PS1159 TaxID=55785 RepID=A0AC35FBL1_9BILA